MYEALVRRAQIIQVSRLYRGKNIGEKFNRNHHHRHYRHLHMDDLCHLCSCYFSVNLVNSTSTTYLFCMEVISILQVQNKPSDDTEGHHKTFVTQVIHSIIFQIAIYILIRPASDHCLALPILTKLNFAQNLSSMLQEFLALRQTKPS